MSPFQFVVIANGYSTRLVFGYPLVSYVNFHSVLAGVPPFVIVFSARPKDASLVKLGVLVPLFLFFAYVLQITGCVAFSRFSSFVSFCHNVHGARFSSGCTFNFLAFVIVCITFLITF